MAHLTEPEQASLRTKRLLVCYVASGVVGLLMVAWLAVVLIIYFVGGEGAIQSLPVRFVFPWLPITALVQFAFKFAVIWSSRKDRQSGTSKCPLSTHCGH